MLTSFRLKVGDTVHDDVVQEERFVVDFDVPRQKAIEVSHIPAGKFQILTGFNFKITGLSLQKRKEGKGKLAFGWRQIPSGS